MSKILIIEDEIAINKMISFNLNLTGYETVSKYDGEEALSYIEEGGEADLAIVDVMLPKLDGFALMEPLTERNIPMIFLTARGDLESKLKGLYGGADDYMVKPFEMLELLARIEKVLKLRGRKERLISVGEITLDTEGRTVCGPAGDIYLTPMEYDLLYLLVKKRNIALSRERLLNEVWGIRYEGGTRTVDVHIAQLRKKTGLNIVSLPKIGYRLEVSE